MSLDSMPSDGTSTSVFPLLIVAAGIETAVILKLGRALF